MMDVSSTFSAHPSAGGARTSGGTVSSRWSRAYPPGRGRWLVLGWEAAGLGYLHWATVRLFDLPPAGSRVLAAALAALWLVAAWRITVMGVCVSDTGLRLRGLTTTRTLRWAEVERITVERTAHQVAGVPVAAGRSVVVTLHSGERVPTPLWEQGMDFHARPALFQAVYRELRDRCAAVLDTSAARGPGVGGAGAAR
jgi:hypothetical protein